MALMFDTTGLEEFLPDKSLETEEGVWFELPGGRRICCKRAGGSNMEFRRAFARAIRPYRQDMDRGTLDNETSDKILLDVYCKTIFLQLVYRFSTDEDGNKIAYSEEMVREFFRQVPEMLAYVVDKATDAASFVDWEATAAKKPLPAG